MQKECTSKDIIQKIVKVQEKNVIPKIGESDV